MKVPGLRACGEGAGRKDSSGAERMFCQAVAERQLACQLMGHVQCEPRILQLLSPFLPPPAPRSFFARRHPAGVWYPRPYLHGASRRVREDCLPRRILKCI